jgi:hypothetical protein
MPAAAGAAATRARRGLRASGAAAARRQQCVGQLSASRCWLEDKMAGWQILLHLRFVGQVRYFKRALLAHQPPVCVVLLQGQAGGQPPLKPATPGPRPGTTAAAAAVTPAQRQEQRRQERVGGRERREERRLCSALAELRLAHLGPAQDAAAAELQSLLVESLVADKLGGKQQAACLPRGFCLWWGQSEASAWGRRRRQRGALMFGVCTSCPRGS